MGIIVKNILVKPLQFIAMFEYYHGSLRQVYFIIITKILSIKLNLILQIFFKSTNNSIYHNKLVSTLLVFGIYSRITE